MNSDPSMIGVFLAYLALVAVPRARISCRLQIHRTADVPSAEAFWRRSIGDDVVWLETTLKKHNLAPVRHNRGESYCGCVAVSVYQSAVDYRRIAGTWEGISAAVTSARSPVV